MYRIIAAVALLVVLTAHVAFTGVAPADLVLTNGRVVTVDEEHPQAEGIAVRGDSIVALGSSRDMQACVGPHTRVIDLKGALAVPGFIDSHAHLTSVGQARMELALGHVADWDEVVRMVGEAASRAKPGQWILGHGWHQEKWRHPPSPNVEGFPLHASLSAVSTNNPVLLWHASAHAVFANARAMQLAGVTRATADPVGGRTVRDADGNPCGVFIDAARAPLLQALESDRARRSAAEAEADLRQQVRLASEDALAKGLTTICDAGSPPSVIEGMRKLVDERKLRLRVWMMLREPAELLANDMPKFRTVEYGDKRFTVRAVKLVMDGALGSRSAWMLDPYADMPGTRGLNTETLDNVRKVAELCVRNKYQLCIHAIGDRANREVLDIYEETFKRHAEKDGKALRWRIEHAQHLNPSDIPRFGLLGVIASMQGIHCTSDAPYVVARLGAERAAGAYAWQSLMRGGAMVCNGTDAPVEDLDPIACFRASVSRRRADGTVFHAEQCMSRMQALRSYTINAAYAAFEDDVKGSLTVGKLADITVLSKDILTVPESEMGDTRVLYTIVGGRVEYASVPRGSTAVDR